MPQPFAHQGPVTENRLLDLPSGEGVRVELQQNLPPEVARSVVAAAVKALTDGGIPASGELPMRRSFVLRADVAVDEPEDDRPEIVDVTWKLLEPNGRPVGKIDQRVDGRERGWSDSDPAPLAIAAEDAGRQVVAYFQRRAALVTVDGAAEAAVPADMPSLYLGEVTGAPGDGNQSLARALRYVLRQAGVPLADSRESASHHLTGRVEAAPKDQRMSDVSVIWRLTDRAGAEVGKVSQRSPVPTESLAQRWGELAFQVSSAAADGILDAFATVSAPPAQGPLSVPPQ